MSQGQGTISQNDLMMKLVQAKKVMNKVDGGNYTKGNINENILRSAPEDIDMSEYQSTTVSKPVSGPVNVNKIQNSKLPDAIKQAMINHPIEQMPSISLNETLDMDFIKGAKRLMEQEGTSTGKQTTTKSTPASTCFIACSFAPTRAATATLLSFPILSIQSGGTPRAFATSLIGWAKATSNTSCAISKPLPKTALEFFSVLAESSLFLK